MPASRHPKSSSRIRPALLLLGLVVLVPGTVGCGSAVNTAVQVPLDMKTGPASFNVQVDQTNDWKPPGWPVTLTDAPPETTLAD